MITGVVLIHNYRDHLDLAAFYKKRFMSIYPMFWFCWIIAFLYLKRWKQFSFSFRNLLMTVTGFDGYLSFAGKNWYLIGEWFLGALILLYLLFPVVRKVFLMSPEETLAVIVIIWVIFTEKYAGQMGLLRTVPFVLTEMVFGMYYVTRIHRRTRFLPFFSVILMAYIAVFGIWGAGTRGSYRQLILFAAANFTVLCSAAEYVNKGIISRFCAAVGRYSYQVFLIHHVVLGRIASKLPKETDLSPGRAVLLYLAAVVITGVLSVVITGVFNMIKKVCAGASCRITGKTSKGNPE